MQVQRIGYKLKGFYKVAAMALSFTMVNDKANQRAQTISFWRKHGLATTLDAFKVSKRTLYRWQAQLDAQGGNLAALCPKSSKPICLRTSAVDPQLKLWIRKLRLEHPNIGKDKLALLLAPICAANDIATPSASTIGRIIANAPDKMRHAPARLNAKGECGQVRERTFKPRKPKQFKPTETGQLLAFDTVVRIRNGLRRYLFTAVDHYGRIAYAVASKSPSSSQAAQFLDIVQQISPAPIENVLTDNGSEFAANFDEALRLAGKQHWFTYPRSPKMNAIVERFNRTIQEDFVDFHEDDLFASDLSVFNDKLASYLIWFNQIRPHHALGNLSPLQFISINNPQCQRYWTHTIV